MPVLYLDNESKHSRRTIKLEHGDGFAHSTQLIPVRVKDADTGQPSDENSVRAHRLSLFAQGPRFSALDRACDARSLIPARPQLPTMGRVVGTTVFSTT
jgi:hypothetical protein